MRTHVTKPADIVQATAGDAEGRALAARAEPASI
jgi:hypothetical protein